MAIHKCQLFSKMLQGHNDHAYNYIGCTKNDAIAIFNVYACDHIPAPYTVQRVVDLDDHMPTTLF